MDRNSGQVRLYVLSSSKSSIEHRTYATLHNGRLEAIRILRSIIDPETQRQQTRFGSDSTSAQLIPRTLCTTANLDRIEAMMRSRMGNKSTFGHC